MHLWESVYFIFNCFGNQFLSSSFVDCSRTLNQTEEIIYLNYKIRRDTTLQTSKWTWLFISSCNIANDISDWTWFVHFCQDSFNNKLMNKQKISLTQQIQPSSEESFSFGSICKYWIYVIDDIVVFTTLWNI